MHFQWRLLRLCCCCCCCCQCSTCCGENGKPQVCPTLLATFTEHSGVSYDGFLAVFTHWARKRSWDFSSESDGGGGREVRSTGGGVSPWEGWGGRGPGQWGQSKWVLGAKPKECSHFPFDLLDKLTTMDCLLLDHSSTCALTFPEKPVHKHLSCPSAREGKAKETHTTPSYLSCSCH